MKKTIKKNYIAIQASTNIGQGDTISEKRYSIEWFVKNDKGDELTEIMKEINSKIEKCLKNKSNKL